MAIRWLLIANAIVLGLALIAALYARGRVNDYAADAISDDELLAGIGVYLAASLASGLLQVGTGVVTIIWQWRLAKNTQLMHRPGLTFGPGWAIAGWLIPCVNFVVPYLQLRELWKASDWSYAAGDTEWKQAPVGPVLPMWVAAWIANSFVAVYAQLSVPATGDDVEAVAEQFSEVITAAVPGYLIAIAAALMFLIVVQQLTERHHHAVVLAAAGRLGEA
ncbi:MAG: DUF4328 domain-containing protein [Acidimicrobiales bacterium]